MSIEHDLVIECHLHAYRSYLKGTSGFNTHGAEILPVFLLGRLQACTLCVRVSVSLCVIVYIHSTLSWKSRLF